MTLCTSPKSNTSSEAIFQALQDVRDGKFSDVPDYLKDAHYQGAQKLGRGIEYRYPHSYPNGYVPQQYLPDTLAGTVYYQFGDNKMEQSAKAYREKILSQAVTPKG